jgi:hypothetical protein
MLEQDETCSQQKKRKDNPHGEISFHWIC